MSKGTFSFHSSFAGRPNQLYRMFREDFSGEFFRIQNRSDVPSTVQPWLARLAKVLDRRISIKRYFDVDTCLLKLKNLAKM
jgi:hypothetical protein